jgi:putative phosphoribosyl transferase
MIDDGLATGATMIAAARSVRVRGPACLVVAAPVASAEAHAELRREVDEVVCLVIPQPFWAVGLYYQDFSQVTDEEVLRILDQNKEL